MALAVDVPWEHFAACGRMDPDEIDRLFFSNDWDHQQQALAICAGCLVRRECFEANERAEAGVNASDVHGIVAMETAKDRRRRRAGAV
jgi:hypothetical protein